MYFLKYAGHFDAKYVEKYTKFGKMCAEMCEDARRHANSHMQHNFRICSFENTITCEKLYAEKYAICRFLQNVRSHVRS